MQSELTNNQTLEMIAVHKTALEKGGVVSSDGSQGTMQRHISLWPELTNNQTLEMIAVDIDFTSKGLD